jgi:hypothetical protein
MDLASEWAIQCDPAQLMEAVGMHCDPWQAQALRSEAKRLLILSARQLGKSTTASLIALHAALFRDDSLILITSKTERQSIELLAKLVRYYHVLGDPIPTTRQLETCLELANGSRVLALPGDPDTIRGFSAPWMVLVDEASRVADDVFAAVLPMLTTSNGRLVVLSTPRGSGGFFASQWRRSDVQWEKIMAKASECTRIPKERLEEERKLHGDRQYAEEFECAFMGEGGQVFRNVSGSIDRGRSETELVTDPHMALHFGIDLGRCEDSSVICGLDNTGKQIYFERFTEVSYPVQIQRIKDAIGVFREMALKNLPSGYRPYDLQTPSIIMDTTGVGLPVWEQLTNDGISILPFTITMPKKAELIEKLAAALDNNKIRLQDHAVQEQELVAYEQWRTPAGNYQYGAPSGTHDDTVIALSLAWYSINGGGFWSAGAY